MTRADDYILDFLVETEIEATPKVIARNIDYSGQYVNERVRPLADAGLIERTGEGFYCITQHGRDYLAGDLDADDLDDPTDE